MVPLSRARILVTDMPRMLRDIVQDAVRFQPDMELVECDDAVDLLQTIKALAVSVAVVAEPGGDSPGPGELLLENPGLHVLVVTDDGRHAHMLELQRLPVVDVSPRGLVRAIRAAVGARVQ